MSGLQGTEHWERHLEVDAHGAVARCYHGTGSGPGESYSYYHRSLVHACDGCCASPPPSEETVA